MGFRSPSLSVAAAALALAFALPAAAQTPAPRPNGPATTGTPGQSLQTDQSDGIRDLGKELTDTVAQSQSDPTIPQIMQSLDQNIQAVKRIRQTLDKVAAGGQLSDADLDKVATEFETVAKSFADISAMAPGVFQRRRTELGDLTAIGNRIGFGMTETATQIDALKKRNQAIAQNLQAKGLSATDMQKLQYEKQVNDTIIHNLETTTTWWQEFAAKHDRLMQALDEQSDGLDLFFYVLQQNARLYDSGAKTLRLGRDISVALRDLQDMQAAVGNVGEVETKLIQSWSDVNQVMDEVGKQLELKLGPGA